MLREHFLVGIRMEKLYIQFNTEVSLQFAYSIHLSPDKCKGILLL